MAKLATALFFIVSLLAGCSDSSLYYGGDYDDQIHAYYENKPPSELIEGMEKIRGRSQDQDKPLPPTFYAHLGLLYQKTGQTQKFKDLVREEKANYPESAAFADFLLKRGG